MNELIGTAKSTSEFTRKLCYELNLIPSDLPSWVVIDWSRTWSECLQFEIYYEEGKGEDKMLYFYLLPDRN